LAVDGRAVTFGTVRRRQERNRNQTGFRYQIFKTTIIMFVQITKALSVGADQVRDVVKRARILKARL